MVLLSRRTPIGVDVGSRQIKAMQLSEPGAGKPLRVEAAVILPRIHPNEPLDADELYRLGQVFERQGFAGRQVVTAVPVEELTTESLELPPRKSGAPLDQIAEQELGQSQALADHEFEMSMWDLPTPARSGDRTHVMATACTHEYAGRLVDLWEQHGFHLAALDIHAWAAARACALPPEREGEMVAVLDLGAIHALLTVVFDGVVIYERFLTDGGLSTLYEALHRQYGLDDPMASYLVTRVESQAGDSASTCDKPSQAAVDEAPTATAVIEATEQETSDRSLQVRQSDRAIGDVQNAIRQYVTKLIEEVQLSLSYGSHRYPTATLARLAVIGGGAQLPSVVDELSSCSAVTTAAVHPAQLANCPPALIKTCESPALTMAYGLARYGEVLK